VTFYVQKKQLQGKEIKRGARFARGDKKGGSETDGVWGNMGVIKDRRPPENLKQKQSVKQATKIVFDNSRGGEWELEPKDPTAQTWESQYN